jgi:hypothetical protein
VVNATILRASREVMGGFRGSPGVSAWPSILLWRRDIGHLEDGGGFEVPDLC